MPVAALYCKHGLSDASFYKWRAKFGGMDVSEATRLRDLEGENNNLKKLLAEAHLDIEVLKTAARGIEHLLIELGKPAQNAYIESFNGKFRDECLNEHWFETPAQARVEIAARRCDYNEVRPHSSCDRMPPAKYAALHRQNKDVGSQPSSEMV